MRCIFAGAGRRVRLEVALEELERPIPPAAHRLVTREEQRLIWIGPDAA